MDSVKIVNFNLGTSTQAVRRAALDFEKTALASQPDGSLLGCKVGLLIAVPTPDPDLTLADLTVATYSGYAVSSAETWASAVEDESNESYLLGGAKTFTPSDDDVPNLIVGAYLVNGTGDTLLSVAAFATPVDISTDEPVVIIPTFSIEQIAQVD